MRTAPAPIATPDRDTPQHIQSAFVFGSLGDCKAFLFNPTKKLTRDLTQDNRGLSLSPTDCGGRLGPYVDGSQPDLRNFMLHFQECEEGDLLLIVSDGVHDNLDPQQLGLSPKDLALPQNDWSEMDADVSELHRCRYRERRLNDLILSVGEPYEPQHVVPVILKHCLDTNHAAAEWMKANVGKRLPFDYSKYPGKMDHTSCLCFRV